MGRRRLAAGVSAPAGGLSSQDAPPIASSQSPLSSVSACGENCARSLAPQGHFRAHFVGLGAPPLPTARGAAGAPFGYAKKRMRRARWKRKNASAGRSAPAQTSCRRRGKAGCPSRQSGTETRCPWGILWPGEVWDTRCADFRCRWPVVDESCQHRPTQQLLRPPGQRVAKRNARKEKLVKCVLAPRLTAAPSATGRQLQKSQKAQACPKVSAKSEQAPIRRPPSATRQGHCTGARLSGLFFWTVHGPFSFPQDGKENGGCIPAGQAPLREQTPPWPPRRRPIPPPPAAGTSAPPSPPPGGPPLPPPPAGKIFLNSQILHRYPLYKRNALRYDNSVSTRRI